ncbi:PREDICTED: uncharacterized protein LOC100641937 [Amphimedon queenslandica]|uniref:SbsA Ig-like domain-containing protein n=1 Tax=Amphimedon queenslandica TaxID=400682 RepID=A0A1X7UIH1_AMPQE|nr:PREDICTED: uncharacterized protein LOC100641937 [Amphimedon queenslandica]|eukprot:XP_003387853.1 PREDICTED: uncharacterized protein LOC100641937 [Amphimedon queenslandica]
MGNKNSGSIEPSLSGFSQDVEESTNHENSYSRPPMPLPLRMSPPTFPKRSYSVLERQKPPPDAYHTIVAPPIINRTSSVSSPLGGITRPSSSSSPSVIKTTTESPSFDDAADHLLEATPKDGAKDVPLGSKIVVFFDKDVRSVNAAKLFEVICESPEQGSTPVKGRVSFDSRQMKVEFTPQRTLFPNSKIIVQLHGLALTTTNCSQSVNIKDAAFSFHTCNPPPKTVGIKLKNQSNAEQLQIANYYDLFNSLINWSSRKWGCSGEHVTGLFSQRDGALVPLKADLDILNVKEDDIIVIEIKD